MIFAILSMVGLGSETFGTNTLYDPKKTYDSSGELIEGWYDSTGHMVAYANLTLTDNTENGRFQLRGTSVAGPYWYINTTSSYAIYDRNDATMSTSIFEGGFNLGSALGIIVIVGILMAVGTIAGIHFFGSGLSDVSVSLIIKGSAFVTLWLIFSAIAMPLIVQIPMLGPIFFFFITGLYTLGIINQVGSPGDE